MSGAPDESPTIMELTRLPLDGCGLWRHGTLTPAIVVCLILASSFIVADLYYYGVLGELPCQASNCSSTIPQPSVKLMMQDHMSHYIHHYGAEEFEEATSLADLPFITPNFITTVHIFVGALGGYLVSSEHYKIRQIAVGVFQFRIFLDMMDGVVYRRQLHQSTYVNGWGTLGYYIDAGADVLASVILVYGLFVYLARHPPRRNEGLPLRHPPEPITDVPVSRSTIQLTLVICLIQGCMRGMLWDRYQFAFHSVFSKVLHHKADAVSHGYKRRTLSQFRYFLNGLLWHSLFSQWFTMAFPKVYCKSTNFRPIHFSASQG